MREGPSGNVATALDRIEHGTVVRLYKKSNRLYAGGIQMGYPVFEERPLELEFIEQYGGFSSSSMSVVSPRFGLEPPPEKNTWDFKVLSYDSRCKCNPKCGEDCMERDND